MPSPDSKRTPQRRVLPGMGSDPGTYALVLRCRTDRSATIGRWGRLELRPGYYFYVGSAFGSGGVSARVARHCRRAKAKHWHIDYLRYFVSVAAVWYSHAPVRQEHRWAHELADRNDTEPIPGFGCGDCRCESHLFFTPNPPVLDERAAAIFTGVETWSLEAVSARGRAGGFASGPGLGG